MKSDPTAPRASQSLPVAPTVVPVKALFARAQALHQQGQLAEAGELYRQVLAARPGHFGALLLLGVIAFSTQQFVQALEWADKSLEVNPNSAVAHSNRGNALKFLHQPRAALESYDRAIALQPGLAEAHYNRGAALKDLGQFQAAIDSYDQAIVHKADFAEAYYNRGNLLRELRQPQAAIESYEKAMALKPGYSVPTLNLGLCLLQLGNFELGWEKYEWRRNEKAFLQFSQPRWTGAEPLEGKTILLHSEQGLGDTLQFCRYAKLVSDLGARVILEVQEPLMACLAQLEGVTQLVARGGALPVFDYQSPLLSLPLAFKTRLDTIPAASGYLTASPGKVAAWQRRLGEKTQKSQVRVGLVWSGSAGNTNDHNRSFLLSELLQSLPANAQYISLQKDVRQADQDTLAAHPEILDLGQEIEDFTDTAALCELVDVVVSADTSVAHLAGAMGKPVWVLLPFNPDWRWLLDRTDSPWYESARLYRQGSLGDWDGVFEKVSVDLGRLIG